MVDSTRRNLYRGTQITWLLSGVEPHPPTVVPAEPSIRVYGMANPPVERQGLVGPGFYMRIDSIVSWSWNMAGEPVGSIWYEPRRAVHR